MDKELTAEQLEATRKIDELMHKADIALINGERLEDADFEGAEEAGRRKALALHAEAEKIAKEAGLGPLFGD